MKLEDLFCDSFERILSDFKTNEDRLQEMVGLMRSDRSVFCQEMRAEPYRFSEEQVLQAAERYRLGGSRNGETVFWLIDEAGRVRDGMVGDTFASVLLNLNVIFLFCREINGEKKNFCLVTNPRKKLKYSMFSEAES